MGKKYGYIRISPEDENGDFQKNALRDYGVADSDIIEEVIPGHIASTQRPLLLDLLKRVQPHDELVVWKLDRIGRSALDMLNFGDVLKKLDVKLVSLIEGLDTDTPLGKFYYAILESFAEMERETMRERVIAGQNAARLNGKVLGRPRKLCPETIRQIQILRNAGETIAEIMKGLNLGRATIYRALNIQVPENLEADIEQTATPVSS